MAFAGLNVTFAIAAANSNQGISIVPIYGVSLASQNMAAAATSIACPSVIKTIGAAMAVIYAAADSWVTIGPNPPDPSIDQPAGGRQFIPATTLIPIFCEVGDKVRWSAA